uniref:Uncharacterized protein n=1 Tax=Strigamia maritima TaxID=126957 RepID=T1IJ82_STRMM
MNILFCVVPRYGAYTMIALGLLQILTNAVYFVNLPSPAMVIPFEGAALRFRFGWSFWLIFVSGVLCMIVGVVIAVLDLIFPHKFSTVLEVDYDTPFDRHIILKDNYKEKFSGKPRSITKGNDASADKETSESKLNKRKRDAKEGHTNNGFEEELGKPSSWKMPRSQQVTAAEKTVFLQFLSDGNWIDFVCGFRRQDGSDVNIDVQAAAMW